NRTCTSAGCLFGPPLPVTNPPQAQLSTCIVNRVAQDAAGMANCSTGETSALSVPLNSDIYLTGNLLAFRCRGGPRAGEPCTGVADTACAPGTCEDDSVARCRGGTNAGNTCLQDSECPGGKCAVPIPPCPGGTCSPTQGVKCSRCVGGPNDDGACASDADCPSGACPSPGNSNCREACNGGTNPGAPCEVPNCGSGGTCSAGGTCTGGPTDGALCCAGGG